MFKGFHNTNIYVEGHGILKADLHIEDGRLNASAKIKKD